MTTYDFKWEEREENLKIDKTRGFVTIEKTYAFGIIYIH